MKKINVTLSEDIDILVKEIAEQERTSKADVIRQAISLYIYLKKELSNGKIMLSLSNYNGKVIKEIVLPEPDPSLSDTVRHNKTPP